MDHATSTALAALARAARTPPARHVRGDAHTALLQSIVDTAVSLFAAEAASIALFEPAPDRLEFHVAAGPQGAGVVGLSVPPTRGIAGYVFSSGAPIALSDVASDPRFDRATAERTGYVPRSIAAVPLADGGAATLGVLQVLDRQGARTFSLADVSRLGIFASQATAAIRASRVARDSERLLRLVLAGLPSGDLPPERSRGLLSGASATLEVEGEPPFWPLVDRLVALRGLSSAELGLMADVLAAVTRERGTPGLQRLRRPGRAPR